LSDRLYGKAVQAVDLGEAPAGPIEINLTWKGEDAR
jgi:hypothetical protein